MAVSKVDPVAGNPTYTPTVNFGAFGTAILDGIGANICDWITGATGGIINLRAWAAELRQDATNAVNSAVTISQGVTGNITGSSTSSNASDVGNSVAILNATVQSSSQPPQTVIVTSTQDVNIPTGCRTVVFNVFAGGGGGARGIVSGGSGAPGGGGGVGGWQKDIAIAASSLPATLHCVVGTGGAGATTDNTPGGTGGTSKVTNTAGTTTYVQATGGAGGQPVSATATSNFDSYNGAPGTGNGIGTLNGQTHGGYGGWYGNNTPAEAGANGSSVSGGAGGGASNGTDGGNGQDDTSTLTPGMAGSGGGGGASGTSGSGHNGGNGGHPSGAGGGGGQFWTFGNNGSGGNGADGEIWLKFVF